MNWFGDTLTGCKWAGLPFGRDAKLRRDKLRLQALSTVVVDKVRPSFASTLLSTVLCLVLLAACHTASPNTGSDEGITVPEPYHPVEEVFGGFFQAHGGIEDLGYPLTEGFTRQGLLVQYFEKARVEYHPGNAPQYRVQLGLLGDTLGRREPPVASFCVPLAHDRSRRHYAQTGHTLSEPFLSYYDCHGGLDRFGYPLSEPYESRGLVVQDFQRGRLIARHGGIETADWGRTHLTRLSTRSPSRPPSR